jgi:hypothetical protein
MAYFCAIPRFFHNLHGQSNPPREQWRLKFVFAFSKRKAQPREPVKATGNYVLQDAETCSKFLAQ